MSDLAILGTGTLLPGAPGRLRDDDAFEGGTEVGGDTLVRTLTGQLDEPPAQMSRWKRLDRYGKALALACDRAVRRDLAASGPDSGLYVASATSCLETNATFDRGLIEKGPRLASPLMFPYTLPGSTASEVAMLLGLRGAYLVLPGAAPTALATLLAASDAIASGEADRILVAAADVLGPETVRWLAQDDGLPGVNQPPPAELAAAIWLARADDPSPGARRSLDGALGPGDPDVDTYVSMIREALDRCGLIAGQIVETVATTTEPHHHQLQSEALARLMPQAEILQLAWTAGDAGAALGMLAVQTALDEETPRLVLAADSAGSVAVVVA